MEWDTSLHTLSNGKTESGVSNLEISKNLTDEKTRQKVFFHDREQNLIKKLSVLKILSQKDDSVISFDTKGQFCYFVTYDL